MPAFPVYKACAAPGDDSGECLCAAVCVLRAVAGEDGKDRAIHIASAAAGLSLLEGSRLSSGPEDLGHCCEQPVSSLGRVKKKGRKSVHKKRNRSVLNQRELQENLAPQFPRPTSVDYFG